MEHTVRLQVEFTYVVDRCLHSAANTTFAKRFENLGKMLTLQLHRGSSCRLRTNFLVWYPILPMTPVTSNLVNLVDFNFEEI